MRTLWAASARHLLRHPAQLALALVGLALGVGTITAVDIATASSGRAFELSMEAVNGAATHQITGGPAGLDERIYTQLRVQTWAAASEARPVLAPVVEGYISVGDRTMQLIGVDPFASAALAGPGLFRGDEANAAVPARGGADTEQRQNNGAATSARDVAAANPRLDDGAALSAPVRGGDETEAPPVSGASGGSGGIAQLRRWFTQPGAVVLAPTAAAQLGVAADQTFTLDIAGRSHTATVLTVIAEERVGYDTLVLTDIAQAQEWFGLQGRLSHIDIQVPDNAAGEATLARIRKALPPDAELRDSRGRAQQNLDMTSAFTTNLQAMSLLALLVSVFLIYSAISFAVVQRRKIIGILRALGATRGEVLRIVLVEATLLGLLGAGIGLLLGLVIGRELVVLVSRTINDLYFVVSVREVALPASAIIKAVLAGLGTTLVAAALPAIEVAGSAPQLGMRRSVLELRATYVARWLLIVSAACIVTSGVILWFSARSLLAGFAALFLLLLGVAAFTPALLRWLAQSSARWIGHSSPIMRLALGDVAASLSRTGVAVAALGMAIAAMIGVSVMVESFRESLREYLARTLQADIYVSAPGPGFGRPERRIEPEVLASLLATPGVRDYSTSRRVSTESADGPLPVDALKFPSSAQPTVPLIEGEPEVVWPAVERGAIIVSEPLAWHRQLHVGDVLTLKTAEGLQTFNIAGVYREYGNDRGNIIMNGAIYREKWRDDSISGLGIYLDAGARPADVIARLQTSIAGRQALNMRSNAEIRELSMSVFENTFVITKVLYWLAAGVAAIGLISALLAWELERSRELAIVRSLGLTPRGTGLLIEAQTGFMGLVAMLAAVPAGVLTALLLINVINRRAFGWQIDLYLHAAQFGNALLLALSAALVAGVYPAWRAARASLASDMRDE